MAMDSEDGGDVMEFSDYEGEIVLPYDTKRNHGSEWFCLRNNEKRYHKDLAKVTTSNAFLPGRAIAAKKFLQVKPKDLPRFRLSNLSEPTWIGSGASGTVWKFKVDGDREVAVKQCSTRGIKAASKHWKERDLNILLKHPRICNMIGAFHDTDMHFVFELCIGTLRQIEHNISPTNKVRFSAQLAQGLDWIHGKNVLHCDLRSENCLVTTSNNVVIADFSNAVILKANKTSVKAGRQLGLVGFQDREATRDLNYDRSNDVFALACIIFQMDYGSHLLSYNCKDNIPADEYVNIFTEGRLVNLHSYPPTPGEKQPREPLSERAQRGQIFGELLKDLVNERSSRPTANEILNNNVFKALLDNHGLAADSLDNDLEGMSVELKSVDTFPKYGLQNAGETVSAENMAYDGIYYDERNDPSVDAIPMPLASYETGVIARHLIEQKAVAQLVDAIAANDPVANGQFRSLVEGWLGRRTPGTRYRKQLLIDDICSRHRKSSGSSGTIDVDVVSTSPGEISVHGVAQPQVVKAGEGSRNHRTNPTSESSVEEVDPNEAAPTKKKRKRKHGKGNEAATSTASPSKPRSGLMVTGIPGVEAVIQDAVNRKNPEFKIPLIPAAPKSKKLTQTVIRAKSPPLMASIGAGAATRTINHDGKSGPQAMKEKLMSYTIPKKNQPEASAAIAPTIRKNAEGKFVPIVEPPVNVSSSGGEKAKKTKKGGNDEAKGKDKTKQCSEKTTEGDDKTKQGDEKTKQGDDKTKQGDDKTKQGDDKTKQGVQKTKQGSNKTKYVDDGQVATSSKGSAKRKNDQAATPTKPPKHAKSKDNRIRDTENESTEDSDEYDPKADPNKEWFCRWCTGGIIGYKNCKDHQKRCVQNPNK